MKTYKQYISEKMIHGGFHVHMYLENPTFQELKNFYLNKVKTYHNRAIKFFYDKKNDKMYYFNPYDYIHSDLRKELGISYDGYKTIQVNYPYGVLDPFNDAEGTYNGPMGQTLYKNLSSFALKVMQEFYLFLLDEYTKNDIQKETIARQFINFHKELNLPNHTNIISEKYKKPITSNPKEYWINPSYSELSNAIKNKFVHQTSIKFCYDPSGEYIYYFDPYYAIHNLMFKEIATVQNLDTHLDIAIDYIAGAIDAFTNSEGTYIDSKHSKHPLNHMNYNVLKKIYIDIFKESLKPEHSHKTYNRSFLLFYKKLGISKSRLEKELNISINKLLNISEDL